MIGVMDFALNGIAHMTTFGGMEPGFLNRAVLWAEEWFPRPLIDAFKAIGTVFSSFMGPIRTIDKFLKKKHKVCIVFSCFRFSLRDLLRKLSGFFEAIFGFALKPFKTLIKKLTKPMADQITKWLLDALPVPTVDPKSKIGQLFNKETVQEIKQCLDLKNKRKGRSKNPRW